MERRVFRSFRIREKCGVVERPYAYPALALPPLPRFGTRPISRAVCHRVSGFTVSDSIAYGQAVACGNRVPNSCRFALSSSNGCSRSRGFSGSNRKRPRHGFAISRCYSDRARPGYSNGNGAAG
jgi:hypothetical protein